MLIYLYSQDQYKKNRTLNAEKEKIEEAKENILKNLHTIVMDSAKQENIKKSMKVNATKGKSCFSLSLTP